MASPPQSCLGLCLTQQNSVLTFPSPTQRQIRKINQGKGTRGNTPASCRSMTYIRDLGVCTFALGAGQLQPLAVLGWAVLLQRALVLPLAPATFEVRVGFQAESAAVPHGPAFVQVNCRDRKKKRGAERCRQHGRAVGCQRVG